jgi:hypothetical protein
LEEEQERERRLQDADSRKRRRTKERSVSMNSMQKEELLPSIRPTHSLPMRPMRLRQRSTHHDQANGFRYPQLPSDHQSTTEQPPRPPPLIPPRATNILPSPPPGDEDTTSPPNSPASPKQPSPCTPPWPVGAPAPLTPFFTPASSPPQPMPGNSVNGKATPPSKQTILEAWAWESLQFSLPATSYLIVASDTLSLIESILIWGFKEHYRLAMRGSSSSLGASDLPRVPTIGH